MKETKVYQKAREEEQRAITRNLIRQNIALEAIVQATEMTIAQLQDLQTELSQE